MSRIDEQFEDAEQQEQHEAVYDGFKPRREREVRADDADGEVYDGYNEYEEDDDEDEREREQYEDMLAAGLEEVNVQDWGEVGGGKGLFSRAHTEQTS